VLAPEYRLAPEHPFPAGLDDATRAYRWMLERGTPSERIVVAGDSAGAGLAMSLLIHLKQEGVELPGGALLFCPFVDLTGSTLRLQEAEAAAFMLDQAMTFVGRYLGDHPIDDPVVSPLSADLSGLPPMLIQAATGDPQREDAHQLTERARAAGVDAHLELYAVETHAFQTFWSFLPEAMEALERGGEFTRAVAAGDVEGRERAARGRRGSS
jgi:acetyl esterase/lipase